ncbi:MAG: sulfurtransferase [bacterium]
MRREDMLEALDSDDTILVDTRTPAEYAGITKAHTRNGHIPGAVNVDWQNHIADLFEPRLVAPEKLRSLYEAVGVTPDRKVITYCRTASRSSHTYFVLRLLGFRRVSNYSGSWTEWNVDDSLPVATGEAP